MPEPCCRLGENGAVAETTGATDAVLSADGTKLYVAEGSGAIDVFDVAIGLKAATWQVPVTPGPISLTKDGASLLVTGDFTTEVYRIDLATGKVATTYTETGQRIEDIQAIGDDKAVVTGSAPAILDLATGTFASFNTHFYNGYSIANSDGHITLLAESFISPGALAVIDDATGAVTASGTDYQDNPGDNFGAEAISQAAGEIIQFIYYESVNIYDLNLHFERSVNLGESFAGMTFNASGTHVYGYANSGALVEYDASTFDVIARFAAPPTGLDSDVANYGNAIQITPDEHYVILTDYQNGGVKILDLTTAEHQITASGLNNILAGTTADEQFIPGPGNTVTGGGGNDTFVVNNDSMYNDHISDFSVGDTIDVNDNPLSQLTYGRDGSNLQIQYGIYSIVPMDIGTFAGRCAGF